MKATDDPLVQARQLITDARRHFATDVDGLLTEIRIFLDAIVDNLEVVSRDEALQALRRFVLEKFEQRLGMHPAEPDPVTAAAPELLAALKHWVLVFDLTATDSYCEACQWHAPKDDDGQIVGPIHHQLGCPYLAARSAIAKAEGR